MPEEWSLRSPAPSQYFWRDSYSLSCSQIEKTNIKTFVRLALLDQWGLSWNCGSRELHSVVLSCLVSKHTTLVSLGILTPKLMTQTRETWNGIINGPSFRLDWRLSLASFGFLGKDTSMMLTTGSFYIRNVVSWLWWIWNQIIQSIYYLYLSSFQMQFSKAYKNKYLLNKRGNKKQGKRKEW